MRFEVVYSLGQIGEKTPEFFKVEALRSGDLTARTTAARVLSTPGDPKAVRLLKDILSLS